MYDWFKTFHIIFMMSWMAGIFYLPRIFVHFADGQSLNQDTSRLLIMAQKLNKFMIVMLVLTLLFGGALLTIVNWFSIGSWMFAKLSLVLLMIGYHGFCMWHLKLISAGKNTKTGRYFRYLNEAPLLLLIPIVYLVVAKPF
ncbi:MAG: CopD family protein [Saccharospirillaceae bacterium]|nr:CopD family protein [Pseudomonadales bacterium]NRB80120.1 CopD family protein [Saccharospirillaceae bacterium]